MKEEDEEEESAEGLFPLREGGKKQPREDTFEKKKRYFSPLLGHNEECKFLN